MAAPTNLARDVEARFAGSPSALVHRTVVRVANAKQAEARA